MSDNDSYRKAQVAMADLKSAVYDILPANDEEGMQNAEIGRRLGIHGGHEGHKGHISRTVLEMMKQEEVAEQDEDSKLWRRAF